MTTTTTSGAADLPKALRLADAISNLLCSNEAAARTIAAAADELVRLHAESEMRRAALLDEMQKAALAAGQATAQPAPQPPHVAQAVVQDDLITLRKPTTSAELLWLLKLAHLVISDVDKTMEETFSPAQQAAPARDLAAVINGAADKLDAAVRCHPDAVDTLIHEALEILDGDREPDATPASHGQAPAYEAGWKDGYKQGAWSATAPTAQAADSVPAPPPPPECETEAEKRAFAFGWFKALESERMKETTP